MGSTPPGTPPLTGFTIGVTADRRRDELAALLRRRGADVVMAPAMRIVPLVDDELLRAATAACLSGPLDYVVATTGVGWRAWINAAEDWGTGEALLAACRGAVLISRGPKATGALRACGLREGYAPDSEALDEVLAWLLARDLRGRRVAVQQHGAPLAEFTEALRHQGASVVEVPVYRWGPPEDPAAVRRLAERTLRREVHALPFTSAPAIEAFLASGDRGELLAALRQDVLPACIGPVCARPLLAAGVPCVWPERGRLGSLVRTLTREVIRHHRRELVTPAGPLALQGTAVLAADAVLRLPPVPAAVLAALADRPGTVLSRAELLRRAWPGPSRRRPDEHAVEAAVGRLRTALGPYGHLVGTVTKRGYRLVAGAG
ncbi:uroporphyrinogen-III synthase [Streptomyces caatingaensis]|uniref:Bifunctional uroporphyrinogen-III synthetase/response regulator domain protein n=1 Tax=Streptomyces caatingaensis TaxID=1678637 RepID=A0A0K9XL48_9ACTN|nr:uroporphyrinogen-III synthase [Streptomyces caatingaensis]KNB54119.1 bifunctional uroporphyrinogen-III synthetase/response regulator domain protein [Streptomyces caatingaensis]